MKNKEKLCILCLACGIGLSACGEAPDAAVEKNSNNAIIFSEEEVDAARQVIWRYNDENDESVTDYRIYQIFYSETKYDEEKQTSGYLKEYYSQGYQEGNVIYLTQDIVWILDEAVEGDWPEMDSYPDWGYWLARDDADSEWEIVGTGY
ncbi:MAG: hypothetical protein LUC90_09480 [Lachnospiraceae bacterium]|nr:hypothetical protein [Lachnospiraceae bacterium]